MEYVFTRQLNYQFIFLELLLAYRTALRRFWYFKAFKLFEEASSQTYFFAFFLMQMMIDEQYVMGLTFMILILVLGSVY
jgi:hypothetical protein